jgi:hypothetical protein
LSVRQVAAKDARAAGTTSCAKRSICSIEACSGQKMTLSKEAVSPRQEDADEGERVHVPGLIGVVLDADKVGAAGLCGANELEVRREGLHARKQGDAELERRGREQRPPAALVRLSCAHDVLLSIRTTAYRPFFGLSILWTRSVSG